MGKRKGSRKNRVERGKRVRKDSYTGYRAIISERVGESREALKYIALFLAFCFIFYLVYYSLTLRGSLSIVKNLTAFILGALFSAGGANVIVQGAALTINGFGLEIIDECTAVFSSIVYCSAVLAYPTTIKNKGLGIAFGVSLLYAINILRLVVLTLVGISYPDVFEFVHVYLWQASFIIFVVVIFLLWLKLLEKD